MEIVDGHGYHQEHFWAVADEDGLVTVGLTDIGQAIIGEITGLDLPGDGRLVRADEVCGSIESEDGEVFDVISPISGTVVEVNEDLTDAPEVINDDPYNDGWLFKVEPSHPEQVDELLSADDYEEFVLSQLDDDFDEDED